MMKSANEVTVIGVDYATDSSRGSATPLLLHIGRV